jgi:hypothetical protein
MRNLDIEDSREKLEIYRNVGLLRGDSKDSIRLLEE